MNVAYGGIGHYQRFMHHSNGGGGEVALVRGLGGTRAPWALRQFDPCEGLVGAGRRVSCERVRERTCSEPNCRLARLQLVVWNNREKVVSSK